LVLGASSKLAPVVAIEIAWIAAVWLHWRWYAVLPLAFVLAVIVVATLRFAFLRSSINAVNV
jgi:hypothetical protein